MIAIMTYMRSISGGIPVSPSYPGRGFIKFAQNLKPDRARGKAVFESKCVACHGADSQGVVPAGTQVVLCPPVWRPYSFNTGAGMARLGTAAAFIKANMPRGSGGTLTDQEAFDVAAYVIEQPRPDFARKKGDWPKGEKPPDAWY